MQSPQLATTVDFCRHGHWQTTAYAIRSQLRMLSNTNIIFESHAASVEAEAHALTYSRCVSYDSESGHMYLVEGNKRMNNTAIGYSQVEVEGCCTFSSDVLLSDHREMLFVLQPGGAMPIWDHNRGIQVTQNKDDRVMVGALLDLRQAYQLCHRDEMLVCLSELPRMRDIGMHVVLGGHPLAQ